MTIFYIDNTFVYCYIENIHIYCCFIQLMYCCIIYFTHNLLKYKFWYYFNIFIVFHNCDPFSILYL